MSEKEASEREQAEPAAKTSDRPAAKTSDRPAAKTSDRPAAKSAGAHAHAHDDYHHAPNRKQYVHIWLILFVLTVLEVGVAYTSGHVGKVPLVSALVLLALAKAGCVALFFMHLKYETRVMKWTVLFPFAFPALYAFVLIAEGAYRALWGGG